MKIIDIIDDISVFDHCELYQKLCQEYLNASEGAGKLSGSHVSRRSHVCISNLVVELPLFF